jgi:hypothetical protein
MADSPSETLAAADLSGEALAIFRPDLTSEAFTKELSKAALFPDAIAYLAHTLPTRDCVKWSLSCIRALQPKANGPNDEALAAVDRWLSDPSDPHRRACKAAGEKAGLSTAAGGVAMAAFFAEGSISPPERETVPVPAGVAQRISAGAIVLAVVAVPKQASERYQRCLALAR